MDRSDIIYLVEYNQEQDSLGIWHKNIIKNKVFCQVVSVNQTEWYEGSRKGLNPQYRFTVFRYDYNGQERVEYNGEVYAIYRTYVDRNETIDLYTELKKGVPIGQIIPPTPELQ